MEWSGVAIFHLELSDFEFCLAWPWVAMACPTRSAKSIRGDGRRDGGGADIGGIGRYRGLFGIGTA